jgi:DNA-binding NarL/FixJ family response regulator
MTLIASPGTATPVAAEQRTWRIVLVDTHCLFRQALRSLLATQSEFTVIGEAGRAAEALELLGSLQSDVLLTDVHLPDDSGAHFIEQVRARFPTVAILVLTALRARGAAAAARKAGALGYLLKDQGRTELSSALREVAAGRIEWPGRISHRAPAASIALGGPRPQHARHRADARRERTGGSQAPRAPAHRLATQQYCRVDTFCRARGIRAGAFGELLSRARASRPCDLLAVPEARVARQAAGAPTPSSGVFSHISQVGRARRRHLPSNPTRRYGVDRCSASASCHRATWRQPAC